MDQTALTIITTVAALLGGAFGVKLLDKWFERAKDQADDQDDERKREFTDNEQARAWLQTQLGTRDAQLTAVRDSERGLLLDVKTLAEQVARLEERTAAQAIQITALQAAVAKWGSDYLEVKAERDGYRDAKHAVGNQLTAATLRAELAERDIVARNIEIDRLRVQVASALDRPPGVGPA